MNVISEDLSQDYIIRAKKSRTIQEKREDGKKVNHYALHVHSLGVRH